jgi:hypothetical protein
MMFYFSDIFEDKAIILAWGDRKNKWYDFLIRDKIMKDRKNSIFELKRRVRIYGYPKEITSKKYEEITSKSNE